jgi:hypothetical protein
MSDPVARLREHLDAGERLDLINGDDLRALLDRLDAAEALLSGYRSAVSFVGADSWDGCSDCIEVLQQAAAADIDRPHSANEIAMGLGLLRLSTVGLLAASEARATAMQARCEALEAALREMSANCCPALCQNCSANRDIARAALTQEPS